MNLGLVCRRTTHTFPPDRAVTARPLSLAWISEELLTNAREARPRYLDAPVPHEEAIEMLSSVARLAELLVGMDRTQRGRYVVGCAAPRPSSWW